MNVLIVVTRERFGLCSFPAQVGMKTSCGVIEKITPKRIYTNVEANVYHTYGVTITLTEALVWGFKPNDPQEAQIAYFNAAVRNRGKNK